MSVNSFAVTSGDETLDTQLRPKSWGEYIGQEHVKKNVKIILEAAKQRGEPPEHMLFYGNTGLGKTTLAYLVAGECDAPLKIISGPALEKAGDLAAILTNISEGSVLFVDEIHRLGKVIEEHLYSAMEEFKLHLVLGKGPMARTMTLDLPKFTLIGATTRLAALSAPLRNRFGATFQLNFYTKEDIEKILARSARILGVPIDQQSLSMIAQRSRFTPRIANRLLKRVRDFSQVKGDGSITPEICKLTFESLGIDEYGLEAGDLRILETIVKKFNGGPVGLQALAASTAEETETILTVYEPYLIRLGFIERTPRGRVATKAAYQRLKEKYPENMGMFA
jgi:Holliday junction DNA helicase RuvB